jgi:pimeloyl-ACP methyl ester carboxylesterase
MVLHSKIIGEGKPFIILHGFLGMGDNWKSLGKKFSEFGYQVHLLDQRNHGRSFQHVEFNYSLMAGDLKEYCETYHLDNVVLLGHSMGGKTAMYFATANPEMITNLVVADIAPKAYPQHHHDILKALSLLNFSNSSVEGSQIKSRGQADEVLSAYVKDIGRRLFLLKNLYWKEKGQLGLRINLQVLIEKIDEIGKALPEGATYNGETLFVRAGTSGYIDELDEISIVNHFPNVKISTIENAGHWLHADSPVKFMEIVLNFLQEGKLIGYSGGRKIE